MEEVVKRKLTDDITSFGSEEKSLEDNMMELSDWLRGGRERGLYHDVKRIWNPTYSRIFLVHFTRVID